MEKINPSEIKILVVDGDANVACGTAHVLQQAGYVTATAANGVEALQAVPTFQPHLVLSDQDMPVMDGMELCHRIKTDPTLADVLVILLSGMNVASEAQAEGLEFGADGYITRPITNRELLARVEAYSRILLLNRALQHHVEELKQVNETARQARLASLNLMQEAMTARDQLAATNRKLQGEITERKQKEDALRESEERYSALFNRSLDCVFLNDFAGNFLDANQAALDLLGYQRAEIGTLNFASLLTEEQLPLAFRLTEEIRTTGRQQEPAEFQLRGKHGKLVEVQVQSSLMYREGKPYAIQGIARDITERKRAEQNLRESEERYRQLFELESDAVILVDCETHRYVDANPSALRLYGYTREEFLQLTPEQISDEPERTRATVGTGQVFVPIRWHRRKNGERFAVEIAANLIQHRGRRTELAAVRDITNRQRTMEMLQETTAQLLAAQRIAKLGTYSFDVKDGHWSSCEVLNEIFGIAASGFERDVAGWLQIIHPQDREEMQRYLAEKILQEQQPFDHVYRIVRVQDQQERWVHGQGKLTLDEHGQVARMSGIIQDITEGKRAELALASERSLLRTLVDHLPLCVYLKDTAGRKTLANAEELKNFGVASEAELLGRTDFDFFPPEQAAAFFAVDQQVMQTGQPMLQREEQLTRPDGSDHWILTSKVPLLDAAGQVTGLAGISLDITERKRAEEAMVRLATAVEQAAETIVITDAGGKITYANPMFEKTTGYTRAEAIGQNPRVLKSGKHNAEFYRQLWHTIQRGEVWTGHFINQRKDGTLFEEEATISPVRDASGAIVNFVAVKRNVTREVELEKQLRQAQKMEAVGQLAGGVAHDFNNLLSSQFLQIGLLNMNPNLSAEVREGLEQVLKDAQRAANLVRQLLLFSRRKEMSSQDLDLNAVISDLAKILHRTMSEQVELRLNLAPGLPLIHADPGMMEQVLLNLAVNARDAMPAGGTLTIATTAATMEAAQEKLFPEAVPGGYVCLRVCDTGTGIPPEILPKIFEPFFTTKEVGKGTGLGLATVFGIVKQHRGGIKVANQPGRGAVFEIFLPAVNTPTGAASATAAARRNAGAGTETILLVEDEAALRLPIQKMLTRHGYTVLEAADGLEALGVWREHSGTIHLLLTDLVMPGAMSGKELADQLLTEQPKLKVMLMSGYSAEIAGRELNLRNGMLFMQKPMTFDLLLATIRRCLEG